MSTPNRRRSLVIEVCQFVELIRREQPEVQKRSGKVGMDFASCESHERRKWECHLRELGLQCRVALSAGGRHACYLDGLRFGDMNVRGSAVVKRLWVWLSYITKEDGDISRSTCEQLSVTAEKAGT